MVRVGVFWDGRASAPKSPPSASTRRSSGETLIELENAQTLPLGLRVDAFILFE